MSYAVSGFRREVDETCALLGCYAAYSGSSIPTFRKSYRALLCPETSLLKNPGERSCLLGGGSL